MISVGFSIGHDRGAVLIRDGEVVVGISRERLTRRKGDFSSTQDNSIPIESIDYCLESEGLTYDDVDVYCYNCTMFDDIEEQFVKLLGQPVEKLHFIPHHLAHAYSTYYSSPFESSVVVVADAMGSVLQKGNKTWNWFSEGYNLQDTSELDYDWAEGITIYDVSNNNFTEVYKKWIKFPFPWDTAEEQASVGGYYGNGSYQLVLNPKTNTWPAGKLMGLASYAEAEYVDSIPRQTRREGLDVYIPAVSHRPDVDYRDDFQLKANVAGVYQREQEQISMELVRIAKEITNSENICVAGGSFLNCNTNEMILKSELFEGNYFVPPADDSGIPLGCAWGGYLKLDPNFQKKDRTTLNGLQSPYFGREYSRHEINNAIQNNELIHHIYYTNFDELCDRVADELSRGRVIGWMQGGSEIGPRALGNRSILANPTKSWMTNYVNQLKEREWYRPFAPSVLYDKQSEVFDLDTFSPYMLVTANVKDEWKSKIPAVTHIDGTSRYQSVAPSMNERYYKLIKSFHSKTGIPLVLNTSFNGPSEPIVETPNDAINTFLNQGLHYLVIGNYLIFKINK